MFCIKIADMKLFRKKFNTYGIKELAKNQMLIDPKIHLHVETCNSRNEFVESSICSKSIWI